MQSSKMGAAVSLFFGLTTGVILTVMGAPLIALHYWEYIAKILPSS